MSVASREVIGKPLEVSSNGLGLDEMADDPDHVIQDFVRWQQSPRSEGYLNRLADHEERFRVLT